MCAHRRPDRQVAGRDPAQQQPDLVRQALAGHPAAGVLERRPFPYDKWLYREALQTQAGRELQPLFESFFAEISRAEIRRIEPAGSEVILSAAQ